MGPSSLSEDSGIDTASGCWATPSVQIARCTNSSTTELFGEVAVEVSAEHFAALREGGKFAMNSQANGHDYGISVDINWLMARGSHVRANGSRDCVSEALQWEGLSALWSHLTMQHSWSRRLAPSGQTAARWEALGYQRSNGSNLMRRPLTNASTNITAPVAATMPMT